MSEIKSVTDTSKSKTEVKTSEMELRDIDNPSVSAMDVTSILSINAASATAMASPPSSSSELRYISKPTRTPSARIVESKDPTYDIRTIFINRDSMEYVEGKELLAGKNYSMTYLKALAPIRLILTAFGLLPVLFKKQDGEKIAFEHRPHHITSIWFHIQGVLHTVIFLLVFVNTGGILLNTPAQRKYGKKSATLIKAEQDYLFVRNLVPTLITLMALLQCSMASYCFFRRRHFIATYFTFWAESLELMRIDAAKGVRRFMYIVLAVYFGILLILLCFGIAGFAPVSKGTPAMLIILTLRIFVPWIHVYPKFYQLRNLGSLIFVFVTICSKVQVLLFLFMAKLLRNCLIVWNSRLERVLLRGEENNSIQEKTANRTSFSHLFKDFACILDLMEGCDIVFANILETYFATQIGGVCFEVYYLYRSQVAKEEFNNQRQKDGFVLMFYVFRTLFVLITVAVSAVNVAEEAGYGLELVRRKGMLSKKSDEEIYFLLSMYISYTGHYETALLGGKYFVMNRSFLVTITGLIFSYFVILIQFTPRLLLDIRDNSTLEREHLTEARVKELLAHVEDVIPPGNTADYYV